MLITPSETRCAFRPCFLSNLTHVEPFITKRSTGPPSMGTNISLPRLKNFGVDSVRFPKGGRCPPEFDTICWLFWRLGVFIMILLMVFQNHHASKWVLWLVLETEPNMTVISSQNSSTCQFPNFHVAKISRGLLVASPVRSRVIESFFLHDECNFRGFDLGIDHLYTVLSFNTQITQVLNQKVKMVKLTRRNSIKPKKKQTAPGFLHCWNNYRLKVARLESIPTERWGPSMGDMTFPRDQTTRLPTHFSCSNKCSQIFWETSMIFLKIRHNLRSMFENCPQKKSQPFLPPKNNASNLLTLPCFFLGGSNDEPPSFFRSYLRHRNATEPATAWSWGQWRRKRFSR